jgi:1-acyl-sn-glycerol-3-phosphate acyltransferase
VRAGELNRFWVWGLRIVGPLLHALFAIRVRGLEHVPSTGPAIFAFNHVSTLDGVTVGIEVGRRLRRPTRFLVAAEFFGNPFLGWILRGSHQIPVHRGRRDQAALEALGETVRSGRLAGLAPEGRIDEHEGRQGLQRIRSGTARVALPAGCPVIPVGVWGPQVRWPRSGLTLRRPWRPKLGLAFGPPILPSGEPVTPQGIAEFTERIRVHLEEQVGQARRLAGDAP